MPTSDLARQVRHRVGVIDSDIESASAQAVEVNYTGEGGHEDRETPARRPTTSGDTHGR
jgi:hypothetical protein